MLQSGLEILLGIKWETPILDAELNYASDH